MFKNQHKKIIKANTNKVKYVRSSESHKSLALGATSKESRHSELGGLDFTVSHWHKVFLFV